jgi:hypothetical protein
MANSISLVTKFLAILDELYKKESLTASMDAPTKPVEFGGAAAVNVLKLSTVGLGTYSRATGYPAGDVTAAWETLTLAASRGRALSVDRMDDEETLGMAFGKLAGEFMRVNVAPEVDAYRFSKYASWSGISEVGSPAALTTAAGVLAAFDVAMAQLDADEVPAEGRKLFIVTGNYNLLKASITRELNTNQTIADRRLTNLDNVEIIPVPQTRFYKGITLDAGASASAGGFAKTGTTGRDINFLLLHPSAVLQAVKHDNMKYFSPDANQTADAHLLQYRLYHDAFVYTNHVKGVYSHIKDS